MNATKCNKRTKPNGYREVLSPYMVSAKSVKAKDIGVLDLILYLAPSDSSGYQVCWFASPECVDLCLNTSGHGKFNATQECRKRKTRFLFEHRDEFLASLRYDIHRAIARAKKLGLRLAIRLNGTSDLPWLGMLFASEFPEVEWYDYTKCPKPWLRVRSNYHVAFSYSGRNLAASFDALVHGINVAVVFDVKKGKPLPETWNGWPVIDGDLHDVRREDPAGVVVGLRAKGKAIGADCAFVVKSDPLIQIAC